jgi:uncharacterized RDD family membrane protein YckC
MAIAEQTRFIEPLYPPAHLVTAGPGRRLAGALLDLVLLVVTLIIGWWVWFAIVARNGQSPGKQLVGMYIIKADGTRAGGGYTWLARHHAEAAPR